MSTEQFSETIDKKSVKRMNPFPGLRPFGIEESHLFFGREGQSEEVLTQLSQHRFVAVIGSSGSGKSSLMYCGVIPILYGGFITQASSEWKIVATRPGNNPIDNLAKAFTKDKKTEDISEYEINQQITKSILRRSSRGLIDVVNQNQQQKNENTLIIIDQFEELFRFKRTRNDDSSHNESEAFVKLLVEAQRQKEVPIYIVLTMRSDFIGDCSQFQELTELINQSNYLVPQMTREDFRKAITGPIAVGGATIEPFLLQQLLNEVGDNPDQLPILQHALMRTWDYWLQQNDLNHPIGMSEYEAIGKMERALSEHANEAFDELSKEGKIICESMFKTLTERGNDSRGIRHPTALDKIAAIAQAPIEEVKEVIEKFRQPGRSFLAPASDVKLNNQTIIDLSHESLMRIWDKLKIWVEEESTSVQMYNRLSDSAALFQSGKTGLWRPPDLHIAINWRNKYRPSLDWALRYNPAFERTMIYLETSEKDFLAEEQNKIKLQKRTLRRTKIFALVLGTVAVVALGIMIIALDLKQEADRSSLVAQTQRVEAEKQKKEAFLQRSKAMAAAKEAEEQRKEAEKNYRISLEQQELAEKNAIEAQRQADIAKNNLNLAQEQRTLAIKNAEEAKRQSLLADEKSKEAFKRRMLSISQSMSVKSLQLDRDIQLKALVAYQSFIFNKEYNGTSYQPDVYIGLHSALKGLINPNYNSLPGHKGGAYSMVFVPGTNNLFSAGSDGQIILRDINGPADVYKVYHTNPFMNRCMDITSDGSLLAVGTSESIIQIFKLNQPGSLPTELIAHEGVVLSLAFVNGSHMFYSVGADKKLIEWSPEGSYKILSDSIFIRCIQVSPNGKYLVAGTEKGQVLVVDLETKKQSLLFHDKGNPVLCMAFSPDGKTLASGDNDGNISLWDIQSMLLKSALSGHSARVLDIAFSPNGKKIASCSTDGTALVWETSDLNHQPIAIKDHESWVLSITFSSDSKYLITSGNKGTFNLIWPTNSSTLAERTYYSLQRDMTQNEWESYVAPDVPYEKTRDKKPGIIKANPIK